MTVEMDAQKPHEVNQGKYNVLLLGWNNTMHQYSLAVKSTLREKVQVNLVVKDKESQRACQRDGEDGEDWWQDGLKEELEDEHIYLIEGNGSSPLLGTCRVTIASSSYYMQATAASSGLPSTRLTLSKKTGSRGWSL